MSQINMPVRYNFIDLTTVPERAGVYAWYTSLELSIKDIEYFEKGVYDLKEDREKVVDYVKEKLDSLIFRKYKEDDYKVILQGSLKPRYEGEIQHIPSISNELISRLIDDPSRIKIIDKAISEAAPFFTAPLYIGMASNLNKRLLKHKKLIESLNDKLKSRNNLDILDGDAGFARQVVSRGFDPMSLFVYILEVEIKTNEHNDIESILNRINFPIFGRN